MKNKFFFFILSPLVLSCFVCSAGYVEASYDQVTTQPFGNAFTMKAGVSTFDVIPSAGLRGWGSTPCCFDQGQTPTCPNLAHICVYPTIATSSTSIACPGGTKEFMGICFNFNPGSITTTPLDVTCPVLSQLLGICIKVAATISSGVTGTPNSLVLPDYCTADATGKIPINLSWAYNDTSVQPQIKSIVQIATNPSYFISDGTCPSCTINRTANDASTSATFIIGQDLSYNKTYYWRLKVYNLFNISSNWTLGPNIVTPANIYPKPNFVFLPTNPQPGQDVNFDATSSLCYDASCVYSWLFEPGQTGVGATTTHAYSNPGDYTVRTTECDANHPANCCFIEKQVSTVQGPSVIMPPNVSQDYCNSGAGRGSVYFQWIYLPGTSGAEQSKFDFQVDDDSAFTSLKVDKSVSGTATSQSLNVTIPASGEDIAYGKTYFWRVRVYDNNDPQAVSDWAMGPPFTTASRSYPNPEFEIKWNTVSPFSDAGPVVGQQVHFVDGSDCYTSTQSFSCTDIASLGYTPLYNWVISGKSTSHRGSIDAVFSLPVINQPATLQVCDGSNCCNTVPQYVTVFQGAGHLACTNDHKCVMVQGGNSTNNECANNCDCCGFDEDCLTANECDAEPLIPWVCDFVSGQCVQSRWIWPGAQICSGSGVCAYANTHEACVDEECRAVPDVTLDPLDEPDQCSSNANCVLQSHTECSVIPPFQCNLVAGSGINGCINNADCTGMHNECNTNGQCITVLGAGNNACTSDSQCTSDTVTHSMCSTNQICVGLSSPGSDNTCDDDSDCPPACVEPAIGPAPSPYAFYTYPSYFSEVLFDTVHTVCTALSDPDNPDSSFCVPVAGPGADQCNTDKDCADRVHRVCNSSNQCVLAQGFGICGDECLISKDCGPGNPLWREISPFKTQ